jgi:signal transduction histidine kinase
MSDISADVANQGSASPYGITESGGPSVPDQGLHVTFEIAKVLVEERELAVMLPRFLSCLIETLDTADAGSIWLHDPVDGKLTVHGAQGYDFDALRQLRLTPGEGMAGRVFESGQAQVYPTAEATEAAMSNLTPPDRELFERATVGVRRPLSAICVPLVADQTTLGVLALMNLRRTGGFKHDDEIFLLHVADLITAAVQTARLRAELDSVQALSEANRLKAELISTLAHEMRTPLTSIKGYSTALLMEEASFGRETEQEFLQIIDEECDILQDLIHDLLESSIIDAGLLRLEPQPVRLPILAENAVEDISRRTTNHHFLVDFAQDFPIVDADPDRIRQVLRNLLDNAIKYSPGGGLIVVRGDAHPHEVVVSVADQGIGIAPEHLNRLFEKFFRAKSAFGSHVVGSGLGLPIAHTIIEEHGGRIWAESRLGEGSRIFFTLPRPERGRELAREEGRTHD